MTADEPGHRTGYGKREYSHAAIAVWGLALFYGVHVGFVLKIGPVNERAADSFWVFPLIASIMFMLLVWAGVCVRKRRRLIGAVLLSLLLSCSCGVSAILATKSVGGEHPLFVALDTVIVIWGLGTLGLLQRATNVRNALTEADG